MKKTIQDVLNRQRAFFLTGKTLSIEFRRAMLTKLRNAIADYREELAQAVYKDLRKTRFEFLLTEISLLFEELDYHYKKVQNWARPKKVGSPFLHFKSKSYIHPTPFGQVLIVSPWNYPFHLTFIPLIGAISAGNTIVLKPSPLSPNVSQVMADLIAQTFPSEYITLFQGNRDVNKILFSEKFDLIFYTGSPAVGKVVMAAAAENLTPVILELGGKNPCIIDKSAKIGLAAKRVVWGKFMNAGQTCTTPDYLFVHSDIKKELVAALKKVLRGAYGDDPQKSDFSRIISKASTIRLAELIKSGDVAVGGDVDVEDRYIAPTVLDNVSDDSPIMQEEIFGPILPILDYRDIDTAIDYIVSKPKPLGVYLFAEDRQFQQQVVSRTASGGVTINDVIMHAVNLNLPFGGVGESGMGTYHGKYSFEAFSHPRGILEKSTLIDVPMRYQPYTEQKQRLMQFFLKT